MTKRHEAPELGDAVVRMMRALVARAAEGDTEALQELQRIDELAGYAVGAGIALAQESGRETYSYTFLARELGMTRQAARQRALVGRLALSNVAHVLMPGHSKRGCDKCRQGRAA